MTTRVTTQVPVPYFSFWVEVKFRPYQVHTPIPLLCHLPFLFYFIQIFPFVVHNTLGCHTSSHHNLTLGPLVGPDRSLPLEVDQSLFIYSKVVCFLELVIVRPYVFEPLKPFTVYQVTYSLSLLSPFFHWICNP